jgi:hypothetical protein
LCTHHAVSIGLNLWKRLGPTIAEAETQKTHRN